MRSRNRRAGKFSRARWSGRGAVRHQLPAKLGVADESVLRPTDHLRPAVVKAAVRFSCPGCMPAIRHFGLAPGKADSVDQAITSLEKARPHLKISRVQRRRLTEVYASLQQHRPARDESGAT